MPRKPARTFFDGVGMVRYQEYLNGDQWAKKRFACIFRAGKKCALCGCKKNRFHVHHNTYERLGQELPEDLVCLCPKCHKAFHEHRKLWVDPRIKIRVEIIKTGVEMIRGMVVVKTPIRNGPAIPIFNLSDGQIPSNIEEELSDMDRAFDAAIRG